MRDINSPAVRNMELVLKMYNIKTRNTNRASRRRCWTPLGSWHSSCGRWCPSTRRRCLQGPTHCSARSLGPRTSSSRLWEASTIEVKQAKTTTESTTNRVCRVLRRHWTQPVSGEEGDHGHMRTVRSATRCGGEEETPWSDGNWSGTWTRLSWRGLHKNDVVSTDRSTIEKMT